MDGASEVKSSAYQRGDQVEVLEGSVHPQGAKEPFEVPEDVDGPL